MFFRDFNMVQRRVSDVVSMTWIEVSDRTNHAMRYRVELTSGEYVVVDDISYDVIKNSDSTYIKADPNTFLLELIDEEDRDNDAFHRTPILTWRINPEGEITPIIPSGVPDDEYWHVLNPNGSVSGSDGSLFKSEDDYFNVKIAGK